MKLIDKTITIPIRIPSVKTYDPSCGQTLDHCPGQLNKFMEDVVESDGEVVSVISIRQERYDEMVLLHYRVPQGTDIRVDNSKCT